LISSVVRRETPSVDGVVACVEFSIEEPGYGTVLEGSFLDVGEGGEPVEVGFGELTPVVGCIGYGFGVAFL
jgi:hypothetical protein